jgi:hypothetical protein
MPESLGIREPRQINQYPNGSNTDWSFNEEFFQFVWIQKIEIAF